MNVYLVQCYQGKETLCSKYAQASSYPVALNKALKYTKKLNKIGEAFAIHVELVAKDKTLTEYLDSRVWSEVEKKVAT